MLKPKLLLAALVTFILGSIYYSTLSTNLPAGDGAELITVGYKLGLAHPPGYPLLTLVTHLFLKLPFTSPITGSSLLSLIFSATSILFFFLDLTNLFEILFPKVPQNYRIAIVTTIIILVGLSYQFWLGSVEFEVFSLHNLFIASLLFIATQYGKTPKNQRQKLSFLAVVFALTAGLSLTHHHTIIIYILPLAIYFLHTSVNKKINRNIILISLFAFLLGLTPYIYVYNKIAANTQGNHVQTLTQFFQFILRFDYGTFSASSLTNRTDITERLSLYLNRLLSDSLYIFLVPVAFGLWFVARKKYLNLLFSIAVAVELFIFLRLNIPVNSSFAKGTLERFFTNLHLLIYLLTGIGLCYSYTLVKKYKLTKLYFLLPLVASLLYVKNKPQITLQNTPAVQRMGEYILDKTPSQAVLLVYSDSNFYTFQYLQLVKKMRPDVQILALKNFYRKTGSNNFELDLIALTDFLNSHPSQKVYIIDYPGPLSTTNVNYEKIPTGIFDKLDMPLTTDQEMQVYESAVALLNDYNSMFLPDSQNLPDFARANVINAIFLSQLNWHAVYLFQHGKLITPDTIYDQLIPIVEKVASPNYKLIGEIYKNAGSISLRSGEKEKGLSQLKKSLEIDPEQTQADTIKLVTKTYGG